MLQLLVGLLLLLLLLLQLLLQLLMLLGRAIMGWVGCMWGLHGSARMVALTW